MEQRTLFPDGRQPVTDDELGAVLRQAIAAGGRLSRIADLALCSTGAEHLVNEIRRAGLEVVRPLPLRFRE
jgi:hypothetical protein